MNKKLIIGIVIVVLAVAAYLFIRWRKSNGNLMQPAQPSDRKKNPNLVSDLQNGLAPDQLIPVSPSQITYAAPGAPLPNVSSITFTPQSQQSTPSNPAPSNPAPGIGSTRGLA